MRPQAGKNLDLVQSLEWAESRHAVVEMAGPFPISEDLYNHAKCHQDLLESGCVQYKLFDTGYRPYATNCIHAISDIIVEDGEHPFLLTGTRRGRDAAKNLAVYFRMTGLMEVTKEYKGDLLEQFNLQHVKRLDVE